MDKQRNKPLGAQRTNGIWKKGDIIRKSLNGSSEFLLIVVTQTYVYTACEAIGPVKRNIYIYTFIYNFYLFYTIQNFSN